MSEQILATARELGAALRELPEVQAFLQADAAFQNSPDVQRLQAQVEQIYSNLVQRQQAGEMVHAREVHDFYRQRDELMHHPLVVERENSLRTVKALFERAGGVISGILSLDYTQLAIRQEPDL